MPNPDTQAILAALAEPSLSQDEAETLMAQLDGHETDSVLEVFLQLHDATDEAELYAAVRLLARWADRPVARALVPALRAMLHEPGVADLNKLAAADLLDLLGSPVERPELAGLLADPDALARQAAGAALEAVVDPLALVRFLDALANEPQELVLALIEDLVALEDPRADALLAPLAQAPDVEVAVSAVVALDELGVADGHALAALIRVSSAYPDELVREQADRAVRRLAGESPRVQAGRPADAYLSAVDAQGGQVVVLLRSGELGEGLFTLLHTAAAGITRHVALERLDIGEVDGLLARLAAEGTEVWPAERAEVARVLEAASIRTLGAGGRKAMGWAAWPWVLGQPAARP